MGDPNGVNCGERSRELRGETDGLGPVQRSDLTDMAFKIEAGDVLAGQPGLLGRGIGVDVAGAVSVGDDLPGPDLLGESGPARPAWRARSACITLMAARWPACSPRYTVAIPPAPIRPRIVQVPTRSGSAVVRPSTVGSPVDKMNRSRPRRRFDAVH